MELNTEWSTLKLTTMDYDETSDQSSYEYYDSNSFYYQTDCIPGDRYCWQRFVYEYNVLYLYCQPVLCCTALLILLMTSYISIKQTHLTPSSLIVLCTVFAYSVEEILVTSFQFFIFTELDTKSDLNPSIFHLAYPLCDVYMYLYEIVAIFDSFQSALIILLAVQRCIMIKYPFDFRKYVSLKTTIISILFSVLVSMGYRAPTFFMSGLTVNYKDYLESENVTDYGIVKSDGCMENVDHYFTEIFTTFETIALDLIPSVILLCTTGFIVHKLRTHMKNFKDSVTSFDQRKVQTRKATVNVVIISTVFLTFHLLGSIIYLLIALVPDTRIADNMFVFMSFANVLTSILKQVVMVTYIQSGEKNKSILFGIFCRKVNELR